MSVFCCKSLYAKFPGIKGNLTRLKHRLKGFCYQYVFNNRDKYSTFVQGGTIGIQRLATKH